jgi:hypothetical protein
VALILWHLLGHPRRLLREGERCSRFLWAAPSPSLDRTGTRMALSRHLA